MLNAPEYRAASIGEAHQNTIDKTVCNVDIWLKAVLFGAFQCLLSERSYILSTLTPQRCIYEQYNC